MDRVVAARKLIGDLVKAEQIEVRRVEIVGRDLAKLVETLKRPPSGQELGEWLEEHAQVTELSASTGLLEELIDRHFAEARDAAVTEARNPDLERQLRDAPDHVGSYQVYADWLQERGDPVGELIALGIASAGGGDEEVARFDRYLKRHEAYLLGGLAPQLTGKIALRWRNGLVQAIDAVGDPVAPEIWQKLLGLRVCELVEAITLQRPADALVAAIADAAPASMQTVRIEHCLGTLPAPLLHRPLHALSLDGGYAIALDQHSLPASLERLDLHVPGVSSIVAIELSVRELEVVPTSQTIVFLIQTRLPRLERLTFDLANTSAAAIVEVLEVLQAPGLRHLTIKNGELSLATFTALAKLPLAPKLVSLGLAGLGLTDDTIAPISGTRGFANLEEIDVSRNELTREGLETARGLARTVISTRQHRRGQSMEKRVRKFAGSRLTAAEEIADPAAWRRAGIDGDIRWARYRGEADYELFISADLSRYGCSCPSSIQPCKHVVALALVAERTPLSPAKSNGIEHRVTSRAGLADLLVASISEE